MCTALIVPNEECFHPGALCPCFLDYVCIALTKPLPYKPLTVESPYPTEPLPYRAHTLSSPYPIKPSPYTAHTRPQALICMRPMQVTGANLVPLTLQKQNMVTAVLTDLLAFALVFSVRLIRVEQQGALPGSDISTASLFIVTQQDDRGLFVGEVSSKALRCLLFVYVFISDLCMCQQSVHVSVIRACVSDLCIYHKLRCLSHTSALLAYAAGS